MANLKDYNQIELHANADELPEIWQAAKRAGCHALVPALPALTVQFNNVPREVAQQLMDELRQGGFDFE